MAVTYFVQGVGLYVAYGLSTDTKPAAPPDNCLFIETDTGRRWFVVLNTWTLTQSNITVSTSPPSSPVLNDIWIDIT